MRSRDWWTWAAAAGVGAAVGWWLGRSAAGTRTPPGSVLEDELDDGWVERWGDRVDTAMDAAADGWRFVGRAFRDPEPPSEARLAEVLAGVPGAGGIEARALGPGLIDLTGLGEEGAAKAARAAIEALPGVDRVLNRIWTPSSADAGRIDALSTLE